MSPLTKTSVGVWRDAEGINSDWGRIEHTRPRPHRGAVGPLMLVWREGVERLLATGEKGAEFDSPAVAWAYTVLGCTFFCLEYDDETWTWELAEAHWADLDEPCPCYIGRRS